MPDTESAPAGSCRHLRKFRQTIRAWAQSEHQTFQPAQAKSRTSLCNKNDCFHIRVLSFLMLHLFFTRLNRFENYVKCFSKTFLYFSLFLFPAILFFTPLSRFLPPHISGSYRGSAFGSPLCQIQWKNHNPPDTADPPAPEALPSCD